MLSSWSWSFQVNLKQAKRGPYSNIQISISKICWTCPIQYDGCWYHNHEDINDCNLNSWLGFPISIEYLPAQLENSTNHYEEFEKVQTCWNIEKWPFWYYITLFTGYRFGSSKMSYQQGVRSIYFKPKIHATGLSREPLWVCKWPLGFCCHQSSIIFNWSFGQS